jgi:hypothetical protein
MLRLWKRRPQSVPLERTIPNPPTDRNERRNKQKNLKASADCIEAFAAIAHALNLSEAALFEDLVAERLEQLTHDGLKLAIHPTRSP